MNDRSSLREQRRSEFVTTAMRVFDRKGAANTSLRDVIHAMNHGKGVGMSVFYYYFKSKDDLIDACVRTYLASYVDHVVDILQDSDLSVQEALDDICPHLIRAIWKMDVIFADKANWYSYLSTNSNVMEGFVRQIIDPLTKALDRWLDRGDLPQTQLIQTASTRTVAWLMADGLSSIVSNGRGAAGNPQIREVVRQRVRESVAFFSQLLGLPLKAPAIALS